jgi:phosphoenolpyruvate carboxykinase (ATP)
VTAIIDGSLATMTTTPDPVFGLHVPDSCPGVPDHVLQPRQAWPDADAYDATARRLATSIVENFAKFSASVSPGVATAGPTVGSGAENAT